jgi:tetratricopeptide (TPR) repeat protein
MRLGEKGTLMNASWLRSLSLLGVVLTLTWLGGVARAAGPQAEEKSEDVEGLLKDLGDEKAEDAPAAEEAQPAAEEDATTEEAAPAEATPAETPAETPVEEPAAEETPAPAGMKLRLRAMTPRSRKLPASRKRQRGPASISPPSAGPRPRADASERPTRRAPAGNDDIFRELGLNREARREQAKELVRLAKDHMKNGELIRAEGRLDEAHRLDPENEEAERLLSQVRFELGDQRGTIAETARWVADLQKVQRDQARTVILRLLNEGRRFQEDGDFAKAVDRYERAIEGIRNFHFNLNLDAELREAQAGLAQSTARKKEKDEEERARFEAMLRDTARAERATSMTYLENQLRELRRKAKVAESEQDYDRAIMLYERILVINPRDEEALDRLESVKELNHSVKMNEHMRRAAENFEIAVLSIEESSVVYQQIFRYPDPKEWERITPKVPSIEDEIAATETTVEKEIKRKLEQPLSVGFDGELLPDALKQLQTFSGINFILTKEGSEAAADKQIKLDRYEDLPLKNVLNLLLAPQERTSRTRSRKGRSSSGPKRASSRRSTSASTRSATSSRSTRISRLPSSLSTS